MVDSLDRQEQSLNKKYIWLILIFAAVVRLAHLLFIQGTDLVKIPIIDSAFYHLWAANISQGQFIGDRIFFMSPLYPYLMSIIYAIFGAKPFAAMIFQIIPSVATVYFIYLIGNRLAGARTGVIAALSAAAYAPFIFYDGTLLTTTLKVFLSAIIVYLTIITLGIAKSESGKIPGNIHFWLLGFVIGFSALARPLVLIFAPFLILMFFRTYDKDWLKKSGTVIAAVAIVLVPIAVRNLIVGQEFTLTTSSAGMNLYAGNNPDATGLYWEAPFLSSVEPWYEDEDYRKTASEAVGRELTTREAGGYWMRQALDWIINNPGEYLALLARKAYYFWNQTEFANNISIYTGKELSPILRFNIIGFWLIAPLGLAGLILLWRNKGWRRAQILWLWIIAYFIGALLFFVASEYRMPILIALHVGTGFFITTLIDRIRGRKTELALRAIVLALIFMPFVNFRTDFVSGGQNARMDFFNYGNTLLAQGKFKEAIERFKKALEIDPYFAEGLLKLAETHYRMGNTERAIEIGKKAGLEDPESILQIIKGGAIKEAYALLNEGKLNQAMDEFIAAGMDPAEAAAETTRISRMKRAQQAFEQGNRAETLRLFKEVRKSDLEKAGATDPSISFNIGFLLWQMGETDSAEAYTAEALELDSMNVHAAYLMARIYNATDRREEAERLIQRVNPDAEGAKRVLNEVRTEMDSLLALGRFEEALETYARYGKLGFEIDPEDKFRIGHAQVEAGNLELGLRLLTEAEDAFEQDPNLFYYQGIALFRLARFDEAVEVFRKAITVDPDAVEPRLKLARIYLLSGKKEEAWRELEAIGHLEILDPKVREKFNALYDSVKAIY